MKRIVLTVCFLLFSFAVAFSGTVIENFKVKTGKNQVEITWKTKEEVNLKEFEIERSTDNTNFVPIHKVSPKGDNSEYKYTDTEIFKSSVRKFYYRVKVIENDGSFTHTNSLAAIPQISSVKQTWGSLKAIFK